MGITLLQIAQAKDVAEKGVSAAQDIGPHTTILYVVFVLVCAVFIWLFIRQGNRADLKIAALDARCHELSDSRAELVEKTLNILSSLDKNIEISSNGMKAEHDATRGAINTAKVEIVSEIKS